MPVYALEGVLPEIDPTAWIAPDAMVIGRVRLGPNSSIWFGAVLRGDNEWIEVGAGSNIQEHAMLHTDMGFPLTIGADCTVGHRAILHGCMVEDESLIGMGAIVLNGAAIGRASLVGAGALVPERKSFPPRSLLVGSPARLVRELNEESVSALRESARHYQLNASRFSANLHQVRP